MTFEIVAATEWRLKQDVGPSRRKRLTNTSFDGIVQQITKQALLCDYRWEEINEFPGASRFWVKLTLPCRTVDLFHNGAGGYRAQFYLGVEQVSLRTVA